jgi:hypothetical protein
MKPNLKICKKCERVLYTPKDPTTFFWCQIGNFLHPLQFRKDMTFEVPHTYIITVPEECEFYMEHMVSQKATV